MKMMSCDCDDLMMGFLSSSNADLTHPIKPDDILHHGKCLFPGLVQLSSQFSATGEIEREQGGLGE